MNERNKIALHKEKQKFSLHAQLTLLVGIVALLSILGSYGIVQLLQFLFPVLNNIPVLLKSGFLGFLISILVAKFVTTIFSNPIKRLQQGMRMVADGRFDVRLDIRSTSTEINELCDGFNMMVQELQSTEIVQTDFVSNVSHEVKTPINAIEGYATLLQSCSDIDETEREYISKILFNTKRLSSLVSNILLLSKVENQTILAHRENYRLDEQIRETIVAYEFMWESKAIDFDVELAETVYLGDEKMMHHVWSNLLSNAIKFSPDGGKIALRLLQMENRIVFIIENEGEGLSENSLKHLFDKFYQGDHSHKAEGNGLGLALAKRILMRNDGQIFAENRDEGGCRFTVILDQDSPVSA